jgi:copper chaperone NosL
MRLLIFLLILHLVACTAAPEPFVYGKDQCHACKMTIMDNKFGAELVTKKGKVYKFDDINCMFNFYNSQSVKPADYAHKLVIDFASPGKLIAAEDALYLQSEKIKSPMASQIAAFSTIEHSTILAQQATQLRWKDLINQFQE